MLAVDTLKAYQDLKAAELSDAQAQAIVGVVKAAQETWLEKLATKDDLNALRGEMHSLHGQLCSEIRELESRTEARFANFETKIERVKFDLLKWLLPFLLGQLALTVTILLRTLK